MWEDEPPPEDDQLRQGDLLRTVYLPRLTAPLHSQPNPAGQGYIVTVAASPQMMLVVSQCCQNEKGKYVALAPVIGSRPVREDELENWTREEPSEGEDPAYVYDCFALDPFKDLVQPAVDHGKLGETIKLRIADLAQATAFGGDWSEFRRDRVARMTPHGRRLVRAKLAYFWSRAEAEDARLLAKQDVD